MKDESLNKFAKKLGATPKKSKKPKPMDSEQLLEKHLENMRDGKTPKGIGGVKTYYV